MRLFNAKIPNYSRPKSGIWNSPFILETGSLSILGGDPLSARIALRLQLQRWQALGESLLRGVIHELELLLFVRLGPVAPFLYDHYIELAILFHRNPTSFFRIVANDNFVKFFLVIFHFFAPFFSGNSFEQRRLEFFERREAKSNRPRRARFPFVLDSHGRRVNNSLYFDATRNQVSKASGTDG